MAIAEFAYNNGVHISTGGTPFFLDYCIHPLMLDSRQLSSEINISLASERAQSLVKIRSRLEKEWVEHNANREKYYNAKHEAKTYKVGDKVWLSGRNICTVRPAKRLDYEYHRPFMFSRCIGTPAHQLNLPKLLGNIHDIFHVSLLEPYHTIEGWAPAPPSMIEVDGEDQAEIEEILDSRVHYGKLQYLVKWLGYPVTDNEWFPADDLGSAKGSVGDFHLK